MTGSVDDDNGGFRFYNVNNSTSSETTTANADPINKPGRRTQNPLGNFASYTYQLSLYMITPDAYDAFIQSGRRQINALRNIDGNPGAGAILIAQSGGINNTEATRSSEFKLDYYIDNLTIKTFTNPKSTMTATNTTAVSFQILEPYGFSFITKLKNVSDSIQRYTQNTGNYLIQNPSRQFFILGIRFLGYDANGNLMTGSETYNGNVLDPNATPLGLFDRYYDILITGIKFKIDGRATTYNITASSIAPTVAFGVKRGRTTQNLEIEAGTIEEALSPTVDKGLLSILNKYEQELVAGDNPAARYPNIYEIEYIGADPDKIKSAKIVTPEDVQKFAWATSQAQNTAGVTPATEVDSFADNTKRIISFKNDTPVTQAISQVVSQSTYLRDALITKYKNTFEPEAPVPTGSTENIAWYNLSSIVSNARWDDIRKDFTYTIKYVIQRYETPILQSVYSNSGVPYYGAHKRYEYWYTGKNSEVLSYEQSLDNLYYNVALTSIPENKEGGTNDSNPSIAVNRPTGQERTNSVDNSKESQNNYLTSLFDPGSLATAKITILGDPDYLAQDSPGAIDELYSKFYGDDGFTINPAGGQVFIEIDFREAIDVDYNTGYLDINDKIVFWEYPKKIAAISTGISYMVIDVTSTFAGGSFKQVLNCTINTFGDYADEQPTEREDATVSTQTGPGAIGSGLLPVLKETAQVNYSSNTSVPFRVVPQNNET